MYAMASKLRKKLSNTELHDTTLGQARYIFNSIDPTPDLIAKAGICECPTTVPALEKNPFGQ